MEAVAKVYSKNEHSIEYDKIDKDAVNVIEKLRQYGYESFLVGGALRDLILGNIPKDFDVVTSASPRQVHKLFYNSRIIGRRFKIVHITYGNKIIEVSTFRSVNDHADSYENQFGTIEEDATRRDFSINSLYYNPVDETLLDFNNALDDFKNQRIRSLIPLNYTFVEDPVRMIRAVKYHVTTEFKLGFSLTRAIKYYAPNLSYVSTSRLTEELHKILISGHAEGIISELIRFKLFPYILPCVSMYKDNQNFITSLHELDIKVSRLKNTDESETDFSFIYYFLTKPFIVVDGSAMTPHERFKDIFRQMKVLISPNTPPNAELEKSCIIYMKENDLRIPSEKKNNSKSVSKNSNAKKAYYRRKTSTKSSKG